MEKELKKMRSMRKAWRRGTLSFPLSSMERLTDLFLSMKRQLSSMERQTNMKIKITGLRVLGMLTLLVVTLEIGCNRFKKRMMMEFTIRLVVFPDTLWS